MANTTFSPTELTSNRSMVFIGVAQAAQLRLSVQTQTAPDALTTSNLNVIGLQETLAIVADVEASAITTVTAMNQSANGMSASTKVTTSSIPDIFQETAITLITTYDSVATITTTVTSPIKTEAGTTSVSQNATVTKAITLTNVAGADDVATITTTVNIPTAIDVKRSSTTTKGLDTTETRSTLFVTALGFYVNIVTTATNSSVVEVTTMNPLTVIVTVLETITIAVTEWITVNPTTALISAEEATTNMTTIEATTNLSTTEMIFNVSQNESSTTSTAIETSPTAEPTSTSMTTYDTLTPSTQQSTTHASVISTTHRPTVSTTTATTDADQTSSKITHGATTKAGQTSGKTSTMARDFTSEKPSTKLDTTSNHQSQETNTEIQSSVPGLIVLVSAIPAKGHYVFVER
nr:serine-rich adhesin for platelets-like [Lytechinus pictus]